MARVLAFLVLTTTAGLVAADDTTDEYPKLIVGKWEFVKSGGDVGPGSTVEFTKDKKVTLVVKGEDTKATVKGTYKLKGDKLTITLTAGDDEFDQTLTVTKLTDDAMQLKDEKGGIDVLKKAKRE